MNDTQIHRYSGNRDTKKLRMYCAPPYITSSASSDSSARSNAAKKNGAKRRQRASRAGQL